MEGRVVRISIAPVKALHLVNPDEVEVGPAGVAGDRRFWLVDADGRLVNDKRRPHLLRVHPTWDEETRRLVLAFPDGSEVDGIVEAGETVDAELYGRPHPSRAVPGPWQEALSDYAGEPVTLLWSESGAVDRGVAGGAVTLISRGSLERLQQEAGVDEPVDGRRFRMLFELDRCDPHEEDGWVKRHLRIGEALVRIRGDVGRCAITTQNPETGEPDFDTLRTISGYRSFTENEAGSRHIPFGIYGEVTEPGRVTIGDAVEVVELSLLDQTS